MKKEIKMGFKEFVALMAMMLALMALAIDSMLPAITIIGKDLGVVVANDNQLIISTLFLGLAIGQLIYGPLSDSIGRKPSVYFGLAVFFVGAFLSLFASSLAMMLVGRALQGFGLSGPRIVCLAIIRDIYKGDRMAQVMSFVLAVFLFVPAIAPAIGQGILLISHWQMIFVFLMCLAAIAFVWFFLRMEETLVKSKRKAFAFSALGNAFKEVLSIRTTMFYTLASGFIFSAFIGMLNSSQQIFQIQFELGERFPVFFAMIALSIALATFTNGKLVVRFGMKRMVALASMGIVLISILFFSLMHTVLPSPSLLVFMIYLLSSLFCIGILFGNLNSMAMEPLGHMAGFGAAVVGSFSTFISVPFGTYIGMQYNGTVEPLVMGFLIFGALTAISIRIANTASSPAARE